MLKRWWATEQKKKIFWKEVLSDDPLEDDSVAPLQGEVTKGKGGKKKQTHSMSEKKSLCERMYAKKLVRRDSRSSFSAHRICWRVCNAEAPGPIPPVGELAIHLAGRQSWAANRFATLTNSVRLRIDVPSLTEFVP